MERYWPTWKVIVVILAICVSGIIAEISPEDTPPEDEDPKTIVERKWSERVITILEHYQQLDPVGIPDAPIPDPMAIPPLKHSFSVATMNFKDVKVYGLSKFKITHMKSDVTALKVDVALRIDILNVNGSYTMSTWISRSAGPFTVILRGVKVTGIAHLAVERGGRLTLQDIAMDVTFEHIDMNFENLGFMGSIFQGIINSVGTFLFDSIKPFILSQANKNIRGDLNKLIENMPYTFPNSVSPFDIAVAEARKVVRRRGYDPFKIEDYNHTMGLFDIHLTHTWLTGLSGFYRNGNITIEVDNGTMHVEFDVGTQRLKGSSHWEIGVIGGMISRAGTLTFTVEYFKVQVAINQSMDTRKNPIIDDIQLDLGNIQVRCKGAGTMDYVFEFMVNVIPNLLRYQIMDALENPVKARIQSVLNTITIDKMTRENLHLIDDAQKNGIKF